MAGIFDRLQNELDNQQQEGGITALDLTELPPLLRRIMRLMLREVEMDYPSLVKAVRKIPEADQLTETEIDQALESLCKKTWLIRRGQGEIVSYRVNLRRKAASTLSQGIWSALDNKIDKKK